MLPEQLLFKEKIDNFEVEFSSIEFSREKNHDKTTEIDRIIDSLSDKVSVLDAEIDKLTNHADTFDYIVAVASGIITGLVDSFWVGEIDWAKAKADAHKTINKFIERKARNEGYTGEGLKGAIEYLEKKYQVPGDNIWSGGGFSSASTHHLDDLAHHPTLLGLVANVITTFFRVGLFNNKDGKWHFALANADFQEMAKLWAPIILTALLHWLVNIAERKYSEEQQREIPKPIRILLRTLASAPAAIILLKVVDNWIGHLISDMGGSKNTPGGGMGILGLFLSLLKEFSSIPGINETPLPGLINDWYKNDKFDMRKEIAVINIAAKQTVPVLINEVLVRGFYFVRRIVTEAQLHGTNWKDYDWEKTIPFSNRTIVRMLTIAHGSFVAVDLMDAATRTAISGQYVDVFSFLAKMALRVNFVGIGRFTIAVYSDVKMGIQRTRRIEDRIDLKSKMLNFYGAKIYYRNEETWIEAEKAEVAIIQMTETAKRTIAFWMQSQTEIKDDIVNIEVLAEEAEKKNSGLIKILTSEL